MLDAKRKTSQRKLLVATHNPGKVANYSDMLSELNVSWLSLADLGPAAEVEESGATFRENAVLKATSYARQKALLTLADDSGLEVDALDGRPGVISARYGGNGLTDKERYQLLLGEMLGVPWEERTARFKAVIALAAPDGSLLSTVEGVCEGMIALEAAGDAGFGYDPVFYLPELGKTMAQLAPAMKHQISHRGRALRAIEPFLRKLLEP